jgi:hypothetical protein
MRKGIRRSPAAEKTPLKLDRASALEQVKKEAAAEKGAVPMLVNEHHQSAELKDVFPAFGQTLSPRLRGKAVTKTDEGSELLYDGRRYTFPESTIRDVPYFREVKEPGVQIQLEGENVGRSDLAAHDLFISKSGVYLFTGIHGDRGYYQEPNMRKLGPEETQAALDALGKRTGTPELSSLAETQGLAFIPWLFSGKNANALLSPTRRAELEAWEKVSLGYPGI